MLPGIVEFAVFSTRVNHWKILGPIIGLLIMPAIVLAQGPPRFSIDVNIYPYLDKVKDDTDLTLVANARITDRFSYFSFVNFRQTLDGDGAFDRTEQNLRWTIVKDQPFDLNVQGVFDDVAQDLWQLGIGWRLSDTAFMEKFFDRVNLIYRLTVHIARYSDGNDSGWQMEHFFRMTFPYISDRLYISGFLDHTFDAGLPDAFPERPIVTEIQIGARLFRQLYVVTEFRNNDFRLGAERNIAVGLEYKFRW